MTESVWWRGEAPADAELLGSLAADPDAEAAAVPVLEELPPLVGLVPAPAGVDDLPGVRNEDVPGPRQRGRKPVATEFRTTPFSVRLTAEERALVYRAAMLRSPGLSVAAWAKAVLVGVAREIVADEGP